MARVSVIVPVYNAEQYLDRCMNSICNQTLKDIEIICVNDGSTDSSLCILKKFAEKDDRIRIISQPNQYAGAARNKGMKYTSGKYLSFLDADDYFRPDMLEKMYREAEENDLNVVICRYKQYDERSKHEKDIDWNFVDSFRAQQKVFSGRELKYAGIFQITKGWAWDKLFNTEFVNQCGYKFPDFRSSEDGFFVYMLMTRAMRISYMEEELVVHRINEMGSLSSTKEQNWINGFKMLLMIKEEMIKQEIYGEYEQSFLNEAAHFMVWYLESMHSFEAYKNCFYYIRRVMEPQMRILNNDRDYFFNEYVYNEYIKIVYFSLKDYLFQIRERNLDTIAMCHETLERQQQVIAEKNWVFPYRLIDKDKVVILYGAGKVGRDYYSQLTGSQFCKEVVWVDRQYGEDGDMEKSVQNPEVIFQRDFDYIFIAIKAKTLQEEIKTQLLGRGVPCDKIKCFGQKM